jgi:long-chain acyl-CoA synthetase
MQQYSTSAVVDIPASDNLSDIVFDRASRDPSQVVVRRKASQPPAGAAHADGAGPWRDVTAGEFATEVRALAKGLIAAGIEPGERVALLSRTRYEWTAADYAILAAGAVTVPIYETSSAEQVEWILTDSGAKALIVETTGHLHGIAEVLRRLPEVSLIWLMDGDGADGQERPHQGTVVRPLTALAPDGAAVTDAEFARRRESRHADDLATIIYTSGTTGRPKGCELSHGNLLADVRNAVHGTLAGVFHETDASTLLFLPLAHSFARIIQIGCLEVGVVLGHIPDVSGLLDDLATFRPTFILAVPRVFEKVYNGAEQRASASAIRGRIFHAAAATAISWSEAYGTNPTTVPLERGGPGALLRARHSLFDHLVYSKLRAAVGGRVKYAVSGGAPLGERLGHFFRGAGITIIEGYGLTECSAAATVNNPDRIKIGTVGQPLAGLTIRIANDGEILICGPTVFAGYWRNEAATIDALSGGCLRTGDMGELDHEGYLRVTGRKKELIVTAGGKNVAPSVLEDRIRAHPLVSQCMAVGDGRPYIACLITLDEESLAVWKARRGKPADATVAELKDDPALLAEIQSAVDDANKAVSRAESVRRFRILTIDFTEQDGYLTPSLKIRRNSIVKDFAGEIDALYA